MFIESRPFEYELNKAHQRRVAHDYQMAQRYGDEPSEIVVAVRAIVSALRAAKGALAQLWVDWVHLRPASHTNG
jgi:hypothetical protein